MSESTAIRARGVVLDVHGRAIPNARVRIIRPLLRGEAVLGEGGTGADGGFDLVVARPGDMPVRGRIQVVARVGGAEAPPPSAPDGTQDLGSPGSGGAPAAPTPKRRSGLLRGLWRMLLALLRRLLGLGKRSRKESPARPAPPRKRPGEDGTPGEVREVRSPPLLPEDALDIVLRFGPEVGDEHSALLLRLRPHLGGIRIRELREEEERRDLSFLSGEVGIPLESLMHLVLADRLGDRTQLPSALFYGFLRYGVPGSLPVPLLEATDGFRLIEPLTDQVMSLVLDVDDALARETLERALDERVIPSGLASSLPELLERLAALRRAQHLAAPFDVGRTPLRELLNAAGLPEDRHPDFLTAWHGHGGTARSFWRSLAAEGTPFDGEEVSALRRTFELGSLTRNHLPAIQLLDQRLRQEPVGVVAALARLELDEWLQLVESGGAEVIPPGVPAAGEEGPSVAFARELQGIVQQRYPTPALAVRVERDDLLPGEAAAAVHRFFRNSPGLDLGRVNLAAWLEENAEDAFSGIASGARDTVLGEAMRLQRVLRITRDPEVGAVLLRTGMDSAARLHALGRTQVVHRLEVEGLTPLEAVRVFEAGSARYGASLALYARYNVQLRGIYPSATGPGAPFGPVVDAAIQRNPSLTNLFGSQDVCAVDPCTSLLSPSAYLADLLLFLRERRLVAGEGEDPLPFERALDAFAARRPDVLDLELDCPNTNTPLPYIDLVNEILEDAVSPPEVPVRRQTTRSAAELRAAPEYVNDEAYHVLSDTVFPHHLPYDRGFDELTAVLGGSGVGLWQLREAVIPVGREPSEEETLTVAAARFGIPRLERDLIALPDHRSPAEVWGTPDPVSDLSPVSDFLQAAQLEYDELLQLQACRWPRADEPAFGISGRDDHCDTSAQRLTGLTSRQLERIHRFLRLWRRAGWAMWEVDELLLAFGAEDGSLGRALRALHSTERIREATGLPVERILSFWEALGTRSHRHPGGETRPSLYTRIFEDPLLPPEPALRLEALRGAGPPERLADHLDAVRAALQLTPEDAELLAEATSGDLSLETLSAMHRGAILIRALRVRLRDAAYLAGGELRAAFASPEATDAFLRRAEEIRRTGPGIPALRSVLTRATDGAGRTEAEFVGILRRIRSVLQGIHEDLRTPGEPAASILARQLSLLPSLASREALTTATAIVDGAFDGADSERNDFLAEHFSAFMDAAEAQALLLPPAAWGGMSESEREAVVEERAATILEALEEWLREEAVTSSIAGAFSLSDALAEALLREVPLPSVPVSPEPPALLEALSGPELIARNPDGAYLHELTPGELPEAFTALRLLDRMSVVVRTLRLSRSELEWMLRHAASIGGVILAELPVLPSQPEQDLEAWRTTVAFLLLDRSFTALQGVAEPPTSGISSLADLLAARLEGTLADDAELHRSLAALAGWRASDVAAAASGLGIGGELWSRVRTYERVRRLLAMAAQTGAEPGRLLAWGGPDPAPTFEHAEEAWRALRSRYDREAWLRTAPEIMDPLRTRRRDALSWALIARGEIEGHPVFDGADLFARFLLDTEMSPCQVTTRVVQAYAAVQLFVQRALLNLEREVPADLETDEGWGEWEWMGRYRVWEAARKVFLWPENWLMEPQRPTRSEAFAAFDREVHQRESTSDSLEAAALGYLEALDEVAHLRVSGMCTDPRSGDLHVVGRTRSDPPRHFVRSYTDGRWTPWTRISHDIPALNLVPAFYAGRLHLFWLQVFLRAEEGQRLDRVDATRPRDSVPPDRYVELRVHFSVMRDGVWTPPEGTPTSFFDKPPRSASTRGMAGSDLEGLYTLKTHLRGRRLLLDIFRLGVDSDRELGDLERTAAAGALLLAFGGLLGISPEEVRSRTEGTWTALEMLLNSGRHLGRAFFDGRFGELQLRNPEVDTRTGPGRLLERARLLYGARAEDLNAFPPPAPGTFSLFGFLPPEPGMRPEAGGLVARHPGTSAAAPLPLRFERSVDTGTLLETVPRPFRIVGPATDAPFHPHSPFVLSDPERSWFFERRVFTRYLRLAFPLGGPERLIPYEVELFALSRFDHPLVRTFRHVLAAEGIDGFFHPLLQRDPEGILPAPEPFHLPSAYAPDPRRVYWEAEGDTVDFGPEAPYGIYNWELFYHLPLLVAGRLAQNQRFDEARRWFHFVFDPTRASREEAPHRFWITRPLSELTREEIQAQGIERLLALVNEGSEAGVGAWRGDPFNPYHVADLRPVAYMKRVVMSYLDNLIEWGDALFATASREALNEATQLYLLASELLGPRPYLVPPPTRPAMSWRELEPELDAFANAVVEVENLVPEGAGEGRTGSGPALPRIETFYFKVPPNERLLAYWDTVEDRLFKLRHCLGLGGEALELPLFDAPIDPALLVRARAAGLDLGSVLLELGTPLPAYRFTEIHRRAVTYADAVRALGHELLAAIEARDAEALATLVMSHRRRVHEETEQLLRWQIEEATAHHEAIGVSIELARFQYAAAEAEPFMSELETASASIKGALIAQKLGVMIQYLVASGLNGIPNFLLGVAGVGGSPQAGTAVGGEAAASSAEKAAKATDKLSESLEKGADLLKVFAEAEKRAKKNKHEKEEAGYRRREAERQQEAAHLHRLVLERRLEMHGRSAEDLEAEREFLQMKFGTEALYDWMVGELSGLYFRAFRLATVLAKRAERCYRFELGLTDSQVIGTGSWDSLRRGLLAGDHLAHDLRRLESSYLELNVRRKEITRTVSLRTEFPGHLLSLLTTGSCDLELDELFFDRDYPGHYQRRIVRAAITVERPDAASDENVVCVVTLLGNSVRLVPSLGDGYARRPAPDPDDRFADRFAAVQGIVTGNALEDPGLFVRDISGNLQDPRYLPFENAGALSRWRIELPAHRNQLDLSTVSDVKLHLHYTALDGGAPLRAAAEQAVEAAAPEWVEVAFDARGGFEEEWRAFLGAEAGEQRFTLPLRPGLLPREGRGRSARIAGCEVHILSDQGGEFEVSLLDPFPGMPAERGTAGVVHRFHFEVDPELPLRPIALRVREAGAGDWGSLDPARLNGMILAVRLRLS